MRLRRTNQEDPIGPAQRRSGDAIRRDTIRYTYMGIAEVNAKAAARQHLRIEMTRLRCATHGRRFPHRLQGFRNEYQEYVQAMRDLDRLSVSLIPDADSILDLRRCPPDCPKKDWRRVGESIYEAIGDVAESESNHGRNS